MSWDSELGIEINRNVTVPHFPFTDYFKGFERAPPINELFGVRAKDVLDSLRVEFFSSRYGYMATNDINGHILVNVRHLLKSDLKILYLDIVHEVCHVKQFMEGKQLFSDRYQYADNPTEIEAYALTVREAKRIGMSDDEIIEYLKVEWMSEDQHERLVERMGLKIRTGT